MGITIQKDNIELLNSEIIIFGKKKNTKQQKIILSAINYAVAYINNTIKKYASETIILGLSNAGYYYNDEHIERHYFDEKSFRIGKFLLPSGTFEKQGNSSIYYNIIDKNKIKESVNIINEIPEIKAQYFAITGPIGIMYNNKYESIVRGSDVYMVSVNEIDFKYSQIIKNYFWCDGFINKKLMFDKMKMIWSIILYFMEKNGIKIVCLAPFGIAKHNNNPDGIIDINYINEKKEYNNITKLWAESLHYLMKNHNWSFDNVILCFDNKEKIIYEIYVDVFSSYNHKNNFVLSHDANNIFLANELTKIGCICGVSNKLHWTEMTGNIKIKNSAIITTMICQHRDVIPNVYKNPINVEINELRL